MHYFAHSLPHLPESAWESLAEHLRVVSALAEQLAVRACGAESAVAASAGIAGLLHDLGKYRDEFQRYIRALPSLGDKSHSQAGAAHAHGAKDYPAAFAVAGHHAGLHDAADLVQIVRNPNGKAVADAVWARATADCPELATRFGAYPQQTDALALDSFTRLVFSCLVDADWTATGEFYRRSLGRPADPLPPPLDPGARLSRALAFIDARAQQVGDTPVARVRADILAACRTAARQAPGAFTLTVPTGGGKTLSGLVFALEHAAKYDLRRVIYVAPYLSIIEQNAAVIRSALGLAPDAPDLFEHHSLADPPGPPGDDREDVREAAARRAENWDAPLVVTTNVQFFESLFANRPGRCRKLHNVARSVVLLDECQALPPGLVAPTCGMLKQLAAPVADGGLGCTVVLCTATQPAFDHPKLGADRLSATEIVPAGLDLFNRLKRVELRWPGGNERWSWSDVAGRMLGERSALCVVNTKDAARAVFAELKARGAGGAFHLSTAMCPAHRLEKLEEVRARLKQGRPTHLVSTQLIEAGVDVSFPVVLRELGPLEGVIQAAGRCNREGELANAGGRVVVFRSAEPKMPPGWYELGAAKVEQALAAGRPPRIDDPADIRDYYERLYYSGGLDEGGVRDARKGLKFATVGREYRLIDGGEPLVVRTWDARRVEVDARIAHVCDPSQRGRAAFRALIPFQVAVRTWELDPLRARGLVVPVAPDLDLLAWDGAYDEDTGLTADGDVVLIG